MGSRSRRPPAAEIRKSTQPSLHAALIAAPAPQPGEHVLHIGVGVGYYTAILAELVGATGRVTAIEYDAELAARATANFAQTPHARVVHGMARESCSNPPTSSMSMPARWGPRIYRAHPRGARLRMPYPSEEMICWPVSARVGNVKNNDPSLIEPIAGAG